MIDMAKIPKKEMKIIRKHFQMLFQGCLFFAGFKNESRGHRDGANGNPQRRQQTRENRPSEGVDGESRIVGR